MLPATSGADGRKRLNLQPASSPGRVFVAPGKPAKEGKIHDTIAMRFRPPVDKWFVYGPREQAAGFGPASQPKIKKIIPAMSTSSQTIEARNNKVLQDMEPSAHLGQNLTVELNQGQARRLVARSAEQTRSREVRLRSRVHALWLLTSMLHRDQVIVGGGLAFAAHRPPI